MTERRDPPDDCASVTMAFTLNWPEDRRIDRAHQALDMLAHQTYDATVPPQVDRIKQILGSAQPDRLKVYLHVGLYEDNTPCSMFFYGSKQGEFAHGVLASLAMSASLALQHGCPVEKIVKQWRSTKFPPEGFTGDPDFPRCTSLLDLAGQWLEETFCVPSRAS